MDRNLNKRFESLERQKARLVKSLAEKWCLKQLHFKPTLAHWSLIEVFDHIVKVDTSVTKYLCKYQEEISAEKLGLGAWWRSLLLTSFLGSPLKVKAPKVPGIQPVAPDDIASIVANWVKSRSLLKGYLEIFPKDKLSNFVFKHPFSGKLNIDQTLVFIYYHTRHHQYQLNRIVTHHNFPEAKT